MVVKILILEHDKYDLELLVNVLKNAAYEYSFQIAVDEDEFRVSLLSYQPHVILSDFNLPSFSGLEAFRIKESLTPETPFIIVSGAIGEEKAVS